jgi:hypothetical protein
MLFREKGMAGIFRNVSRLLAIYLPALLVGSSYLIYHYRETGWVGYDPEGEQWVELFQHAGLMGSVKNVFIIFWRLTDFGRLFLWLTGMGFLIMLIRKKWKADDNTLMLVMLLVISLIIYTPSMIIYTGLLSHRYLLPVYSIFTVLIGYLLFEKIPSSYYSRYIYIMLLAGLLSGNFWVYPDSIAKGWDATLAHIPYYKLRRDMIRYLDKENIPVSEVGTEVPNNHPFKFVDLVNDPRSFAYKDLNSQEYILYSNIYNMFTDEELQRLKNEWIPVKELRSLQVKVILYRRPDS